MLSLLNERASDSTPVTALDPIGKDSRQQQITTTVVSVANFVRILSEYIPLNSYPTNHMRFCENGTSDPNIEA
jgi:hypothetical protein